MKPEIRSKIDREMRDYWRRFWSELNGSADFDSFFKECPSIWYIIEQKEVKQ